MRGTQSLPLGQWNKWTWQQYLDDSRKAAAGFKKLGLEEFGSVCIFGYNAPQWLLCKTSAIQYHNVKELSNVCLIFF